MGCPPTNPMSSTSIASLTCSFVKIARATSDASSVVRPMNRASSILCTIEPIERAPS